ncbi:hypothetical protein AA101099_1800 [Neoasaia chiangmaiensis NBRC 101099]|uniref:Uncharacterized protein n=1 Tax=Neoasaia chiangmaiensis TaxID=320497 RepID=A0A1U9KR08_9PROT|nr:hypothetical protein [Neoasaia chiangmaiensis]AQS88243.1 hypothetical protein A0U93_10170 [Neoasaia chiangmaiensis]GBR39749.1 hypothetical protein AA101099_1800 [Neoasaia chiangmaiensis NBRC 101099]GEN14723.1 hypothetical protein NCH01_11540 [Neoasaia chiangmaiensis]
MSIRLSVEAFGAQICSRPSLDRQITSRCIQQFSELHRHQGDTRSIIRTASRARVAASKALRDAMFKVCSGNAVEHEANVLNATAQHTAALIVESWILRQCASGVSSHASTVLAAQIFPPRGTAREAK